MNSTQLPLFLTSSMIFLSRSSNSPRYLVPATSEPMSRVSRRLPIERLGHVARGDALREALDDGRLADARLADQRRVVLGAPRQDLHDALDLLEAADHRVELAGARGGGQVHAELVDDRRLAGLAVRRALAFLRVGGRLVQDVNDLRANLVEADAERLEHAGGDALAFADQAEQQVLGADVVVVQSARFVDRQLDDLLGARRQADVAGDGAIAAADDELDRAADFVELDAEIAEHLGGNAFALANEAEQQVLGADVVVVEALRLLLRKLQDFARPLGEFIEAISHVRISPRS